MSDAGGGFGRVGEAPIASEAVRRIDILFEIERTINGKTPEQRLAVRHEKSGPIVADLEIWMLSSGPCSRQGMIPQRRSTTRCGCREKKLDLRWIGRWWPSRRCCLYPDRNLQDERRAWLADVLESFQITPPI
jgi:hypothetical protein